MVPHRCDRGIWWGSSGSGFVGWGGRVCEVRTISLSVVVGVYCGFGHRNYQRVSRPARSSIRNCLIERRDPSKTQAPSFRTRPGWSCCRLADQFSTLGHLCSSVGSVTSTGAQNVRAQVGSRLVTITANMSPITANMCTRTRRMLMLHFLLNGAQVSCDRNESPPSTVKYCRP